MIDLNKNNFLNFSKIKLNAYIYGFSITGIFLFIYRSIIFSNHFKFDDEIEKFVAGELIKNGKTLYLDIFAHHGVIPYLISHTYITIFNPEDYLDIRRVMIMLALISAFAIYKSPIFKERIIKIFASGLYLSLLSAVWIKSSMHLVLYQPIIGLLYVIILSQLFFPLFLKIYPSEKGVFWSGFVTSLICFSAYSAGPAIVFLLISSYIASNFIKNKKRVAKYFLIFSGGFSLSFLLIIIWFFFFGDLKGYFVYHFYFNQEIYSQFINFDIFNLSTLFNKFSFKNSNFYIINNFSLIFLSLSYLIIFKLKKINYLKGKRIAYYISLFFFNGSVLMLNPRHSIGFHDCSFIIALISIFSILFAFLFRNYNFKGFNRLRNLYFITSLFLVGSYEISNLFQPHSPSGVTNIYNKRYDTTLKKPSKNISKIMDNLNINSAISLVFNPSLYLNYGLDPSSGHYYYLPWQAKYNKNPLWGYKIDICEDIKQNQPDLIYFDNWKVWNKYSIKDYEPCIIEEINSNYRNINKNLFLKNSKFDLNSANNNNFNPSLASIDKEKKAESYKKEITLMQREISTDSQALLYIASYPDLIGRFRTNIEGAKNHYKEYGYSEGRIIKFNPKQYLANYKDLYENFGSDLDAATRHYINYGYNERRTDKEISIMETSKIAEFSSPVEIYLPKLDNVSIIGLKFATYSKRYRAQDGTAELVIVDKAGNEHIKKFNLAELNDNQYKLFYLDNISTSSAFLKASKKTPISIWQSRNSRTKKIEACLIMANSESKLLYLTKANGCSFM